MKILHLTIAAAAVAFSMAASAESMAPAPTPKGTHLGNVIVNPYGYSPLTAVINRNTKQPTDIKVTVKASPTEASTSPTTSVARRCFPTTAFPCLASIPTIATRLS